jgi:hypothetical protein
VETDGVLGTLTTCWTWCGPSLAATTWALMGAGQRRARRSEGERGEEQEGTHPQAILAGPSAAELLCLCVGGAHEVSARRVHRGCGDGMRAGARLLTRIWWMVVFGDGGAWVFGSNGVCQRCRIGVSVSARVICALGSIDLFPRPVPESGAFCHFTGTAQQRAQNGGGGYSWGMTRTAMSRVRPALVPNTEHCCF